jgi:hypothetical protein
MNIFAPKNATDIVGYIRFIWGTVFSEDIEMSEELKTEESGNITRVTMKVSQCPICRGYGDDKEDFAALLKETLQPKGDGYACILLGMIEGLANNLFESRKDPYKIKIIEKECMALGGKELVFEAVLTKLDA